MAKQTITVKSNEENPEPIEIIAQAVIDVSDAFKKIENSRLSRRAIVLLIKDRCNGIGITEIETILNVVPKLKDYYIKQLPKDATKK